MMAHYQNAISIPISPTEGNWLLGKRPKKSRISNGGNILDPFFGIEREREFFEIGKQRMGQGVQMGGLI